MPNKIITKKNTNKHSQVWLYFILFYISIMSLFVLQVSAETFTVYFLIVVIVFRRASISRYAKHWIPFIGFFFLYEMLRGFADDISPFYNVTLLWIYKIESRLFTELPTAYLQSMFLDNRFIVNFFTCFLCIFVLFPILQCFCDLA